MSRLEVRRAKEQMTVAATGTPINQLPSAWAVYVNLTDAQGVTQQLFWDYVYDEYFTWSKGVFLCHFKDDIWQRIAGVDQYPSSTANWQQKLVDDCVRLFNEALDMRWPNTGTQHPVDQATYEYLIAHLYYNTTTQRFEPK
jgi:hypothetical protein